jgi:hypothetical protein
MMERFVLIARSIFGGLVRALCASAFAALIAGTALAAGPIETSRFAVQGVSVDITDIDAATAKNKALVDVQMKAFVQLAEELGSPSVVEAAQKLTVPEVMPFLRSLSIEEEVSSPGRYQGKFTVRFQPKQVRAFYSRFGVSVPDAQGPAILVIPVWTENGQVQLWGNNPWASAWRQLRAEKAELPIILPLGDNEDTSLLTADDVANNDPIKLEKIRRRYDVKNVLVAYAKPAPEGGVHALMEGATALGKVKFDKVYQDDRGSIDGSAQVAVNRFHEVMQTKYRSDRGRVATAEPGAEAAPNPKKPQSIPVAVAFSSPSQWNGLRSRILATPGVIAVDLASLDLGGATVSLRFSGGTDDLQNSLQASGLKLDRAGDRWVIEKL